MSASVEEKRQTQSGESAVPSTANSLDANAPIDPAAERKLLWKLDLVILPVFFVIYMMSFLDRINISNARIQGMDIDLNLGDGPKFSIALFTYYISYIIFEIPSNMVIKHVRPSIWIAGLMFCWGIINMSMGFVHSFGALVGLRVLLGFFEAGVLPGIIYVTSMYYKRHEYQKRISFFFCSTVVAGAFGGLLAYAIANIDGGRHAWRWIFIIEGAITAFLAIVAVFVVIDWPEQTRYLNAAEKDLLRRRMALDTEEVCRMDTLNKFSWNLIWKDYKIWLCGLIYMGISVPGLSGTFFLPLILLEFGWEAQQAQVHTIPVYVFAAGMMLITAYLSDKLKNRSIFMLIGTGLVTIGYGMLLAQDGTSREYKFAAVFPVFGGAYMVTPMALVWLQNNLSGHWKRSFGASTQVCIGNIAGVIGANIFIPTEAPTFLTGYATALAFMWVGGFASALLAFLLWRENKKRDAGKRDDRLQLPEQDLKNMGDEHPSFRYTL